MADSEQKDFARRQEIWQSCQQQGYADRAAKLFADGETIARRKILEKALFERSTYTFEQETPREGIWRFLCTTAKPTEEEQQVLLACNQTPCLEIAFDLSLMSGDITDWQCLAYNKKFEN